MRVPKVCIVLIVVFPVLVGVAVLILAPKFVETSNYGESAPTGHVPRLFPVEVGSRWGFIDETGMIVVPPQFSRAERFSEGLALVGMNGKIAYVDESGGVALRLDQVDDAKAFSDGLAEVHKGNLWGYIDKSGKCVIKPQFVWTEPFSDGIASVRGSVDGDWYPIDKTGRQLSITPSDQGLRGFVDFREGRSVCILDNGLFGYIDHAGRWVIKPTFYWSGDFSEGLASARYKTSKWGYINQAGTWAIRPKFFGAGSFSEGLAPAKDFSFSIPPLKWGFIDRQGRFAIRPNYDNVTPFCGGVAFVEQKGKVGAIDRAGKVIIPIRYDLAGNSCGQLVSVGSYIIRQKARTVYYNKKGQQIWPSPGTPPPVN